MCLFSIIKKTVIIINCHFTKLFKNGIFINLTFKVNTFYYRYKMNEIISNLICKTKTIQIIKSSELPAGLTEENNYGYLIKVMCNKQKHEILSLKDLSLFDSINLNSLKEVTKIILQHDCEKYSHVYNVIVFRKNALKIIDYTYIHKYLTIDPNHLQFLKMNFIKILILSAFTNKYIHNELNLLKENIIILKYGSLETWSGYRNSTYYQINFKRKFWSNTFRFLQNLDNETWNFHRSFENNYIMRTSKVVFNTIPLADRTDSCYFDLDNGLYLVSRKSKQNYLKRKFDNSEISNIIDIREIKYENLKHYKHM